MYHVVQQQAPDLWDKVFNYGFPGAVVLLVILFGWPFMKEQFKNAREDRKAEQDLWRKEREAEALRREREAEAARKEREQYLTVFGEFKAALHSNTAATLEVLNEVRRDNRRRDRGGPGA